MPSVVLTVSGRFAHIQRTQWLVRDCCVSSGSANSHTHAHSHCGITQVNWPCMYTTYIHELLDPDSSTNNPFSQTSVRSFLAGNHLSATATVHTRNQECLHFCSPVVDNVTRRLHAPKPLARLVAVALAYTPMYSHIHHSCSFIWDTHKSIQH